MTRFAFSYDCVVSRPDNFVAKPQRSFPQFGNVSPNYEFIVVVRRRFVAAIRLSDNQKRIVALFHVPVGKASGPTVIRSPYFEPDQVIGIIDDAHLVRFGITDTDHRFVPGTKSIVGSRAGHLKQVTPNSLEKRQE